MKTSEEVPLTVIDMALTLDKDLLLSVSNDSDLKLLKRTGEIVSLFTLASLLPHGIHVTKNNDVIVGVKEPGNPPFTLTDQSIRAVILYGINGKQKCMYQYDNSGKRLFTIASRITTNKNNNDFLVVDRTSGNTGRVVVLNKEGNFRWIYEGHHGINTTAKLYPTDIATTSVGYIKVSDRRSHALHVLSEKGEVLACKVMRDMGIIGSYSLDIDNEGRLWLWCSALNNKTDAKLHIIKFIGKDRFNGILWIT